jgi:RNA polymerase sigma-70 factor (ECF subfamily)
MTTDPAPSEPTQPLSAERQEEFVGLLNATHGLLLRYVMSLVVNRHDAEDVLQRASLVMWRRFNTFEAGTDFIAWATTVAFYEARNFQRVTGRSRVEFDDDLMRTLAAERVEHVRHWSLRTEALEHCTQKLDAASRQLVKAIYTDGAQAADIARRQGCAPKTISNKLTLIRRALAECVQRRMAEAARTA